MWNRKNEIFFNLMLLPGMIMLLIFSFVPMFGLIMAFQNFVPAKGMFNSNFVGFDNFKLLFMFPDVKQMMFNTIIIAVSKIVLSIVTQVVFALLLSEVYFTGFKRIIQTICYLPNFLSWVILSVIMLQIFSYTGMINQLAMALGLEEPIMFLASNTWFRPILIFTDVWKGFGFGAIIYLAAITSIDMNLYEAADVDGATRLQKIWYITLPGIVSTIVLMTTLALGNVLNAGFEQIFTMYNAAVYKTSDIIDTYVYRMGLANLQYSFGTAVGLLKSVVSFVLIVVSYKLADKYAGYRIF